MGTYANSSHCQLCPRAETCDHYDHPDYLLQCMDCDAEALKDKQ